jgi:putative FmdB family regulatory protein
MPIYEYECDKCGHAFEREQRMSDPPVKTCPKCKGRKVTKLISQTSFVLKGGGWYADGYSDSKKGAADSTSSSTASSSDATAASSTSTTTSKDTDSKSSGAASSGKSKGSKKGSGKSAA